jgi:hypothetical protein
MLGTLFLLLGWVALGGQTTLGFSIGSPQNLFQAARWGELAGTGKCSIDRDLSSLVGMALNAVGKKTEDRAGSERADAGQLVRAVLFRRDGSSRVESTAATCETLREP